MLKKKYLFSWVILIWPILLIISKGYSNEPALTSQGLQNFRKQRLYDREDLKILATEKSYQEFFHHAHDIPPRKRDSSWKSLVKEMAEDYAQNLKNQRIIKQRDFQVIEKLFSWQLLKNNGIFSLFRGQIGLKYFNALLRKTITHNELSHLFQKIEDFWIEDPRNDQLGISFAKMLFPYKNRFSLNLWNYLKNAPLSKISKYHCREQVLQEYLIQNLQNQVTKKTNKSLQGPWASKSLNKDCWLEISKILEKGKSLHRLTYLLKESFGESTQKDRDLFYTNLYLQLPKIGADLNYAWATIEELGQNYQRREEVFTLLKHQAFLPDGLFAHPTAKKRRIFLDHLHRNFPEYMDFYAKTCLSYFKGERKFKKGNPTLHCKKLVKIAQGKGWLDQKTLSSFKELPKL